MGQWDRAQLIQYVQPGATCILNKVEKTKRENVYIAHLLPSCSSSLTSIAQKLYAICEYYTCTCQTTALLSDIFLFWLGRRMSYDWQARVKKRSPSMQDASVHRLLFMYCWCGTYSQATHRILNSCNKANYGGKYIALEAIGGRDPSVVA